MDKKIITLSALVVIVLFLTAAKKEEEELKYNADIDLSEGETL